MRLWGASTAKRAPVALHSDSGDDVSESTTSRSSSSAPSLQSPYAVASPAPVPPPPVVLSAQKVEESPAARAPSSTPSAAAMISSAASAPAHRFTSGALALRGGSMSGTLVARPMVQSMVAQQQQQVSQALTVQAIHQRSQSAQQPQRIRRGDASSRSGSHAAPGSIQTPPCEQSARSSRGGSFVFTTRVLDTYRTMNLLVLGAPQVGKSLFINTYRAAITNTTRWPAAPVGIAGFYGTTTVEPFPNHPQEPTWLCIDTPGRLYTTENEVTLEKLVEGMPWKTKLVGPKALSASQLEELTPVEANKAHQCVIVVPATDLIVDDGWINVLLWRSRYRPSHEVGSHLLYLKTLTSSLRALMNDAPPFVVVTKMDKFGGAGSAKACDAIAAILSQCMPVNRIYFIGAVQNRAAFACGRAMVLESSTKRNLVRLHEDICLAVQWGNQMRVM